MFAERGEPVHVRHLHVHQHRVHRPRGDDVQRHLAAGGQFDPVALQRQRLLRVSRMFFSSSTSSTVAAIPTPSFRLSAASVPHLGILAGSKPCNCKCEAARNCFDWSNPG